MDFDPLELVGGALGRSVYELLRQRLLTPILVTSPAAGAEFSVSVPAGETWELVALRFNLATSAVVANRSPLAIVKDTQGNELWRAQPNAVQAASLSAPFSYASGYGDHLAVVGQNAGLPDPPLVLPAGFSLSSLTAGLDVGDAYTAIRLFVRQWSITEVQASLDWLIDTLRR